MNPCKLCLCTLKSQVILSVNEQKDHRYKQILLKVYEKPTKVQTSLIIRFQICGQVLPQVEFFVLISEPPTCMQDF